MGTGATEIARRRAWNQGEMPNRVISTVHKAKGLESDRVVILPVDAKHFRDSEKDRCVLYVALSRAKKSLTLVVPHDEPSPLLRVS